MSENVGGGAGRPRDDPRTCGCLRGGVDRHLMSGGGKRLQWVEWDGEPG